MGAKGDRTREAIKGKAYELFAANGYKQITMKDICQAAGLSRGGVYRHFDSTRSIFEEIFSELVQQSRDEMGKKIEAGISARNILSDILKEYKRGMEDKERSLSLAMCEYSQAVSSDFFVEQNRDGKARWKRLIRYGIDRGEFECVDEARVTDLILFSYQGVRMWSNIIPMDSSVSSHIVDSIWRILTGEDQEAYED